jgi:hypothetical protein
VSVVARFELVFDDDRPALLVQCLDIQPELTDRRLGGDYDQMRTEFVAEDVEVLGQPGREGRGFVAPDVADVGHPAQPTESQIVNLAHHRRSTTGATSEPAIELRQHVDGMHERHHGVTSAAPHHRYRPEQGQPVPPWANSILNRENGPHQVNPLQAAELRFLCI